MNFVKGMRVRVSQYGLPRIGMEFHPSRSHLKDTGTVISYNPRTRNIRVQRDGSTDKNPTSSWSRYWEPIPDEPR